MIYADITALIRQKGIEAEPPIEPPADRITPDPSAARWRQQVLRAASALIAAPPPPGATHAVMIDDLPKPKKIAMPKKLFRKWLRALRSGQYDKGTDKLCSTDGTRFTWDGGRPQAREASRAQKSSTYLESPLSAGLPHKVQVNLGLWNDAGWAGESSHSHAEIADWIEANLIPPA